MKVRFFADHCIPSSVIQQLRDEGFVVLRLQDYLPRDAPDDQVLLKAQELNCVLLSLDTDFTDIISYPPRNYKGIIALQVRNHPSAFPQLMNELKRYLSAHPEIPDYAGKLLIVETHRIRIRT